MENILEDKFLTDTISVYNKLLEVTATNKFYTNTIETINQSLDNLSISDEKKSEMIVLLNTNLATSTISKTMDQATILCDKSSKITLENNLLQKQIDNIASEITVREAQSAKDLIIKDKQALDIAKGTELKATQITSMTKEDVIKENQSAKDLIIKDKQALRLVSEISLLDAQVDGAEENVLDRQQKRPIEVANLTKQGTLIDGQVSKLTEDKLYVIAQKTSMLEQVGHNKIIKAMDSMGDMIGTLGAGGLVPNSTMFGVYFRLNKLLTNEAEPTNYAVTKAV